MAINFYSFSLTLFGITVLALVDDIAKVLKNEAPIRVVAGVCEDDL